MKKLAIFFALFNGVLNSEAQTLITYGKNKISKEEFLRAYNKNITQVENKEKSIREYVELFSNFKLKVKAAQELHIDTSAQIINDLENFRHQVEGGYLNDQQSYEVLKNQAFQRSQEDLHVIHYFIPIGESPKSQDTLKAYQAIYSFYNGLSKQKDVQIPSEIHQTDLGFITVFTLPYTYENIIYDLKPGELSKPYRSKKAWHIFKLEEKRNSAGKWKIAQILFTYPPNPDEQIKLRAQKLADSAYALLINGVDFATVAREMSEDKLTYLNGGEIPEFGVGKYDPAFEQELMSLTKDGDLSNPFSSSFGVHILKRIKYTPTATSPDDESLQYELKYKLMQDDRIKIAREKFAQQTRVKTGFRLIKKITTSKLFALADSIKNNVDYSKTVDPSILHTEIIGFTKSSQEVKDWIEYIIDSKTEDTSFAALWESYKDFATLEYYRKHLEEFNKEFANQLNEFKEGNMLFEVMEKEVWSRAAKDSIGLRKYYSEYKEKYKWSESADVLVMNCATEEIAQAAIREIENGATWQDLIEANQGELQGDSGRFELSQINASAEASPGSFSPITKNADGTASFIRYYRFYPTGLQRSFEDSKGMLINDYQPLVEQQWITQLRKRYPVIVDEAVLQSIIREQ